MLSCYVLDHDTEIPYCLKLPANLGKANEADVEIWLHEQFGKQAKLSWLVTDKEIATSINAPIKSVLPGIPVPAEKKWEPRFTMKNPLSADNPSDW